MPTDLLKKLAIADDFDKLYTDVLKSDIFSEIDLCEIMGTYTLNDIMERVGLKYHNKE